MTHHDIWDFDPPTAPILADITVEGRPIKAVAQLTKQGFVFVLDRETGKPVWPIEERPVPKSDVPGEWTSPTQPFPTKPAAVATQGVTENDLVDFTPEIKAEAIKVARQFRLPVSTAVICECADASRARGAVHDGASTGRARSAYRRRALSPVRTRCFARC
jgi:quinoprotein glucose dehydrogenase